MNTETEFQERCRQYEREIARQQSKIVELEGKLRYLHDEVKKQQETKQHLKSLYVSMDGLVIRNINTRGYKRRKNTKATKLSAVDLTGKSKSELISFARHYDIKNNFQYNSLSQDMKLHYRLAGKVYRLSRDTSKKGVKKLYRLTKQGRSSK